MKKALLRCGFLFAVFLSVFLFFTKTLSGQEFSYNIQQKLVNEYYTEQEVDCITEAVYFEARGESVRGHKAVIEIILNRVDNQLDYPNKVCDVIYQKNQFSYRLYDLKVNNKQLYNDIKEEVKTHLFYVKILNLEQVRVIKKCSDHYDGKHSKAHWIKNMKEPQPIGNHIFYCRNN